MKTPSDHLFKLIKALTKSEKRAFRIKALNGKDSKKYLAIFNAIEAQDAYDEAAIKKKFRNENWIKRFNAAKEYLYKALMDDLSVYNQSHEPQYKLSDFLIRIRVLQSKGFYLQSSKLIEKAKKLAEDLGDNLRILELLNLESINHPGGVNPKNGTEIRKQQQEIYKLLNNESIYDEMYKESFIISLKSGYQGFGKKEAKSFDKLMESDMLLSLENALTFKAKRQHINIQYFYALGNSKFDDMHKWIMEAKKLFESKPLLIKQHPVNYATTLLNLNRSHMKRKEYSGAREAIQKIRSFYPKDKLKKHERLTYIIEYASLHHEVSLHNALGEFDVSSTLLVDLNNFFNKHKQEISEAIIVRHYYLLAQTYFGAKDYKACKASLDKIIENTDNFSRTDIQKQARLFMVAVYFELKKFDLLEYTLRSSQRYFQKAGSLTEFEKKIFKLMQHSLDQFDDKSKAGNDLETIESMLKKTSFVPDYKDLRMWVTAKIEKIEFATVIQKYN